MVSARFALSALEIQRSGKSKGVHSVPERSRGKAENTI